MSGLADVAASPAHAAVTQRSAWRAAESLTCAILLLLYGLRVTLPAQVPLALLGSLALAPVWLGVLRRHRPAALLAGTSAAAVAFGVLLTIYSSAVRSWSKGAFVSELALIVLTLSGAAVVLWARGHLGDVLTGSLFGVGMMMGAALRGYSPTLNAWKGAWGIPIAVTLLALSMRSRIASVLTLALLAGLSAMFDTRSYFAVLSVALLLVLWQFLPRQRSRPISWLWTAALLATLAGLVYILISALLVNGYLGAEAQQRSIEQINTSGLLILGGRPEIAATGALMREHPMGYGFGILPDGADLNVAKEGLSRINYNPNNGYVERYMFGSGFELHSVVGDLWVRSGPLGIVVSSLIVTLIIRQLAIALSGRRASGLLLFLSLWSFWNLLFSPLLSAYLPLVLVLGFCIHSGGENDSLGETAANNGVRDERVGMSALSASSDVSDHLREPGDGTAAGGPQRSR
jgi:hypothetical protein